MTASHVDAFHTASADFKAKVKDRVVVCHTSTVLLQGYWFHIYLTEELKTLFHRHRREYKEFGPVGIYPDAEAPSEP